MNLSEYRQFTDSLLASLSRDPRVVGVVALGSMAEQGRLPDQWSDHDFFVIVRPGEQASFRANRDWLPDAESIALFFQETAHGCKAVYDSGHLIEFAIFDPDEISLARVNAYRVLLDRGGVAERMAEVAARTEPRSSDDWLIGQMLTSLLVALLRARRGETMSARSMLRSAVRHFAALMPHSDNLDPLRRFEISHPELAARVERAMRLDAKAAALGLLDLFAERVPDQRAIAAIRRV